jgi:hypothetical protein
MGGFAVAMSQQENEMKTYLISGVMLAMLVLGVSQKGQAIS